MKLDLYRKFSNALAVTVISSVVWIGYEVRLIINLFSLAQTLFIFYPLPIQESKCVDFSLSDISYLY